MGRGLSDFRCVIQGTAYDVDFELSGSEMLVTRIYHVEAGIEIAWNDNVSLGEMIEADINARMYTDWDPYDDD